MQTEVANWQFKFEAIGTPWVIDIYNPPANIFEAEILRAIQERIAHFDSLYSRFKKDSLVTKISLQAGPYTLPIDAKNLFDLYQSLYNYTNGVFTPLIGTALEQAGYDSEYSLVPKQIEQIPTWNEALVYNFPSLEVKLPVLLDFGAAGKGYLVDIIGKLLESYSIDSYCIDASGDILYKHENKVIMEIGLEDPEDTSKAIGVVKILDQSLCASSGNRRKWQGYSHILDPSTLKSPTTILATWVVAKEGILADALATCLFFVDPEVLGSHYSYEYLILYKDRSIKKSNNFPAQLFYE